MTDETKKDVPEAVRNIVEAMVGQALARCDRLGISHADFYRAMLEEQKMHPPRVVPGGGVAVAELFERTFRRLGGMAN